MMRAALAELAVGLRAEVAELTASGPRARLALMAALAVGLSTLAALLLHLGDPWWAGISAFICTQASAPQSIGKGVLRIAGTLAGAALVFLLMPVVAYDPAAMLLLLFASGTLAILGSLLSPHGYAWLLGGLTVIIVALGGIDQPQMVYPTAVNRTLEITVGVLAALGVALLLAPAAAAAAAPAAGWASLLDRNWHMLRHAMRTGLVIAAVPVVWRVMELPALSQMGISVAAVMAVPVLTGNPERDREAVLRRAIHRVAGCALGAGAGVLLLALPAAHMLLPWLLLLMAGAGLCVQVQAGRHGVGVVGLQAAIAYILTLVQGPAPPLTLIPAIDRMAGMLGAMALLLVVALLLGPGGVVAPAYPLPPPAGPR